MANKRNYKSNVFAMLLEDQGRALELYNAVNNSNYDDPTLVEINTIEGGFELSIQNDASFIFDNVLSIYEHQSTYCPNMPLRSLVYFATLVQEKYMNRDIFSRRLVSLPTPKFIVFYNGTEPQPEYSEMKLSDCFINKDDEKSMLELLCKVYNINAGKNKKLLERCRWLADYMVFVDKVREYHKGRTEAELEEDISKAIDYCIENNYLKGFFTSRRSEVLEVTKVDYTFERRMKLNYEEGREDGLREGETSGKLKGKAETIRELIKNEKWSAEKAMKSVGIPESEYDTYLKML
ncbi:MAG TPA: hypothetical protein DCR12_07325 [Lachnospiraceae bacterium]|nr:hypothetical protein [Lachnospiraceae bacterium]